MILFASGQRAVWDFLASLGVANLLVNLCPPTTLLCYPLVTFTNPTVLQVTLRWSKTDTFGAGVTIHLRRSDDILCPVKAVLAYLAVHPATSGPHFLLSLGVPLSRQFLVVTIRRDLSSCGLDVTRFNGHSFRIGAATTASLAGLPDSTIQLLGRWKSSAFTSYLRPPVQALASVSQLLSNHQ